jgi:hypothetical protein
VNRQSLEGQAYANLLCLLATWCLVEILRLDAKKFLIASAEHEPQGVHDGRFSRVVLTDKGGQTRSELQHEGVFARAEQPKILDLDLGYMHAAPLRPSLALQDSSSIGDCFVQRHRLPW